MISSSDTMAALDTATGNIMVRGHGDKGAPEGGRKRSGRAMSKPVATIEDAHDERHPA